MEKSSIGFDGVFDSHAAARVEEALSAVKQGGALEVDLTRVREFHDVGLALLARTIRESGRSTRLDVRGLGRRQHRLLRYFGVELAVDEPVDDLELQ